MCLDSAPLRRARLWLLLDPTPSNPPNPPSVGLKTRTQNLLIIMTIAANLYPVYSGLSTLQTRLDLEGLTVICYDAICLKEQNTQPAVAVSMTDSNHHREQQTVLAVCQSLF